LFSNRERQSISVENANYFSAHIQEIAPVVSFWSKALCNLMRFALMDRKSFRSPFQNGSATFRLIDGDVTQTKTDYLLQPLTVVIWFVDP
jgi:hypothetical protein